MCEAHTKTEFSCELYKTDAQHRFTMLNFCKYFMQFGAYNNGLNAIELYADYLDEVDYIKDHLKNKLYI